MLSHSYYRTHAVSVLSGKLVLALAMLLVLDACAGFGQSLGHCERVSTGAGPEDFVILAHGGRQWVLLGSAERGGLLGRMKPGRIEAVELHEDGRLQGSSQQIEPKGWSQDDASQFRPVGMFLGPRTSSGYRILYVVNALGRSIESFRISFEKPSGEVPFSLIHDGTLPSPDDPERRPLKKPNDVVAAPSGRVFVSSFRWWRGHIARFEPTKMRGDDSRRLYGPNGLAYDPKRKLLYVAIFYGQSIKVFNLEGSELGNSCTIELPDGHYPDNLTWSHETVRTPEMGGVLYAATHGSKIRSACHLYLGICSAPSGAVRIDVSSIEPPTSKDSPKCVGVDKRRVKTYPLDVNAASTATQVGHRMIVSQLKDPGLSSCRLE